MVVWRAGQRAEHGVVEGDGRPASRARLAAGMNVAAELVRNVAVNVVELGTKIVLGLAACLSISQGVKPTAPDMRTAGAFVPHQLLTAGGRATGLRQTDAAGRGVAHDAAVNHVERTAPRHTLRRPPPGQGVRVIVRDVVHCSTSSSWRDRRCGRGRRPGMEAPHCSAPCCR